MTQGMWPGIASLIITQTSTLLNNLSASVILHHSIPSIQYSGGIHSTGVQVTGTGVTDRILSTCHLLCHVMNDSRHMGYRQKRSFLLLFLNESLSHIDKIAVRILIRKSAKSPTTILTRKWTYHPVNYPSCQNPSGMASRVLDLDVLISFSDHVTTVFLDI